MTNFIAKARRIAIIIAWIIMAVVSTLMTFALSIEDSPEVAAHKEKIAAQEAETEAEKIARVRKVGAVIDAVKSSLRAPDSLSVRQVIVTEDGTVCMSYGAQNGFGGMSIETIAANTAGIVDYAKHCSGKPGIDETSYAKTYVRWS